MHQWVRDNMEKMADLDTAAFQRRLSEATEAAKESGGGADFLFGEFERIFAEHGMEGFMSREDLEEFAEMPLSQQMGFLADCQSARTENLFAMIVHQQETIGNLIESLSSTLRLVEHLMEEAAKSPKHLSAFCREQMDLRREAEERENQKEKTDE